MLYVFDAVDANMYIKKAAKLSWTDNLEWSVTNS
jgi:hypothetical protein